MFCTEMQNRPESILHNYQEPLMPVVAFLFSCNCG